MQQRAAAAAYIVEANARRYRAKYQMQWRHGRTVTDLEPRQPIQTLGGLAKHIDQIVARANFPIQAGIG